MSYQKIRKPIAACILAGTSALALSGCLLSPGAFNSELALMKDGSFSYSYDGEIQMLALSKLAEMGAKAEDEFEAEPCFTDDYETRECTAAEIAEQKAEWEEAAEARAADKAREAEQMKVMLGGLDPSNPEAAAEFAAELERQAGWSSVEYVGDGLFNVEFSIRSTLTHDFGFPTIEGLPMGNMFVTASMRDGNQVRINAPGFAAQGGGNPMAGMMSGFAGLAQLDQTEEGEDAPRIVVPEGTFTIVTDGTIRANNTDEGPSSHANGQILTWEISPRTEQAPTALISFE